MSKKIISLILAGLLAVTLFSGCGKKNNTALTESSADASESSDVSPEASESSEAASSDAAVSQNGSQKLEVASQATDVITDDEWSKLEKIVTSVYFLNFSSVSNLDDATVLSAFECIVDEQQAGSDNFFIKTQKRTDGNYVEVAAGNQAMRELFGFSLGSESEPVKNYLTNDGGYYRFPDAGGAGVPQVTSKTVTAEGNGVYTVICTLVRTNAMGETTFNNNITLKLNRIQGSYSAFQIISMTRRDG